MRRFLTFFLGFAFVASLAHGQLTRRTLVWQGKTRTWYEHLPAGYDGSKPAPMVIALHGFSDSGDKFAALSEWETISDANGVIVVFPNGGLLVGVDFGWNNFVFDGSAPDDVGFLLALVQRLAGDYKVDPDRVFMTGFSNGAGMTNNFAGVHSEVLAGIAPVSGGWLTAFDVPESDMHPAAPLPVWVWGNQYDNFANGSEDLDVEEQQQLQWWIGFDGDDASPDVTMASPYLTRVYPGGKAEARFTEYLGGEHAYQPGTSAKLWSDFFGWLSRQTLYTPPTTYHDWQLRYFSEDDLGQPSISGDGADPDGDGVSNLMEYASGRNPRAAEAGVVVTAGQVKIGADSYLTISFPRQPLATDLTYTAETSADGMATWSPGGVQLANGALRDDQPIGASSRFMRLRVTLH